MNKAVDKTCRSCKFSKYNGGIDKYECRRYPPIRFNGYSWTEADFPIVDYHTWCGEWQDVSNTNQTSA